jgi:hypothetical protein
MANRVIMSTPKMIIIDQVLPFSASMPYVAAKESLLHLNPDALHDIK